MPTAAKRNVSNAGVLFVCLVVIALLSQAFVQVFGREAILAKAKETSRFSLTRIESAKRGRILAADGRPLARDEQSSILHVNFQRVPQSDGFFSELSSATGVPATELRSLAFANRKSREWRRPLSAYETSRVRSVKDAWRADGLSVIPSGRRSYPLSEAAAGIVGLVKEGKAIAGLEMSQDSHLKGQSGVKVGLIDRTGAFLPMRLDEDKTRESINGEDIVLTIDYDLQQAASLAVRRAVEKHKAEQGAAVVLNPRTGDIVAMANWPTFDPNAEGGKGAGMSRVRDFNPATMASFEPGSTFKPLTLAKALDTGDVSSGDRFYCSGATMIGSRQVRCDLHGGTRAHGQLDIDLGIAKSCNIWASMWSRKVGYDDFVGYLEDLGLMEAPGTGLPGERAGKFNYNDYAKQLQLGVLGFGQAINVTPLALCTAFAALANDGTVMFPRLVQQIGEKSYPPEIAAKAVSKEAANRTMQAMTAVIESDAGTGKSLRIPGYTLAGKTGTAQKKNAKSGGYVSNFVGYVPAQNPEVVILVMIDRPTQGGYYGAIVAGPAFVEIARAAIRRYSIPPEAPQGGAPKGIAGRSRNNLILRHG